MSSEGIGPEERAEVGSGTVILIPASNRGPDLPIIDGEGSAQAIIWPGMGARTRSIHIMKIDEGSATVPLRHRSESVYYVLNGGPALVRELDSGEESTCPRGAMVFIEGGTRYSFTAVREVEILGGPCPPDESIYPSP